MSSPSASTSTNKPPCSSVLETKPSPSADPKLTAKLYHNDMIMEKIIESIDCIESRMNLETVSYRCYQLSRRIGPPNSPSQRVLNMYSENTDSTNFIEIGIGSFKGKLAVNRYFLDDERSETDIYQEMKQKILNFLNKITARFANYIDEVNIGTIHYQVRNSSLPDDRIYVCKEIMQAFDRMVNLKKMNFYKCKINADVAEYLTSEVCKLKNKLTHLLFSPILHSQIHVHTADLIGPNLEELQISSQDLGIEEVAERLQNLNIKVKKIILTIYGIGDETEYILNIFRNCTENLEIVFWDHLMSLSEQSLVDLARVCNGYENVSSISLFGFFFHGDTEETKRNKLKAITRRLGQFTHLKHLHLKSKDVEFLTNDLITEVVKFKNLKTFVLIQKRLGNYDIIDELVSTLPDSIVKLTLGGVTITKQIIDNLVDKYGNTLQSLKINRSCILDSSTTTGELLKKILEGFENLEELKLILPLQNYIGLNQILEKKSILKAKVAMQPGYDFAHELVLRDHFSEVRSHFKPFVIDDEKLCYICWKMAERKVSGTLRIPNGNLALSTHV